MIKDRLDLLRQVMKREKIDYYLVPTEDPHGSEYVGEYYKCREYLTGFTGSAGTALIWQEGAGLWTDARYHSSFRAAALLCSGMGKKMCQPYISTWKAI